MMAERPPMAAESSFLQQLQIDPSLLGALPPNVRDQLLEYVHFWTSPAEQLMLIDMLRQAHGSLLFLLDYQATAYYEQGNFEQVLATVERRQRRSTTLRSSGASCHGAPDGSIRKPRGAGKGKTTSTPGASGAQAPSRTDTQRKCGAHR